MDKATAGETGHIREIDALRGLAACIVAFIVHQHFILGGNRIEPFGAISLAPVIIRYGETMVDLFFVISGYVFAHVYYREASGLRGSVGGFILARIARLYPLHIATALMMFILLGIGAFPEMQTPHDGYHLLLNLFMLQESGLETGISLNRAAWSISIEVYCYLAFLIAVVTLKQRAPLAFGAFIIASIALLVWFPTQTNESIARGLFGYFIGGLLYLHRAKVQAVSPLLLCALVGTAFAIESGPIHPGFIMSLLAWPALILLVQNREMFRCAAMQWLGDRSYSIYMLHTPVYLLVLLLLFGGDRPQGIWTLPAMLVVIATTLVLADLSYRRFELPARNLIKGLSRAEVAQAPTLAVRQSDSGFQTH
jgi:peptidoglycan/LPS O-acetylase OafA/YrhL